MKIIVVTRHREEKILAPLSESNINYTCVTSDKNNLIKENIELLSKVNSNLQKEDFDLILTDHADISGFLTAALSHQYQVPLVVRLGGEVWYINQNKIKEAKRDQDVLKYAFLNALRQMNKYTFNRAEGFLTVSDHLRKKVISKFNLGMGKVQTTNVPIRDRFIQRSDPRSIREKYNIEEKKIITTVTNLRFSNKYRGLSEIVPGISNYLADNQDTAWVIAGGGYYKNKLEQNIDRTVEAKNIKERIFVLGHVDDIENVYSLSDVFVYNSYLDGYPNVILEAQIAGVPVITTNQEGMSEQIEDSKTGLFFSPTDPSDLEKKINMLFDNPELREKMLEKARQKVLEQNSPEFVAKQLEEALSAIIRES